MPLRKAARLALQLVLATSATLAVHAAHASDTTTRLIVGFQAGGGLDTVARALADALNRAGGQRVIVENRPGASGMIAIDAARNAKPGDSVLVILPSGSITMTPHTNPNFRYDPERDLVPVSRVATYSMAVAVLASNGAASLPDFLKRASASSAMRTYGTAGIGLSPHYIGVRLAQESGINLVHVPYKGAGPAINDTLGGQVAAVISTTPSLLPMLRDGRLKLLATSGAKRDPNTGNVPTFKEAGYRGIEVEEWFGVMAPPWTSPEAAARWNAAINRALESEGLKKTLLAQGFVPAPMPQRDFRELVLHDFRQWREALKDSGDTFSN